jgi:hypothetical protein
VKRTVVLVVLVACGRTGTLEAEMQQMQPPKPGVSEQPLFVFTGDLCPGRGTEADLAPQKYDGLVVVKMTAQRECTGAGGDWLVGDALDADRGFFAGSHACWFLPQELEVAPASYFAVVRYSQTAGLFHGPMGGCITDADGREPVKTDSKNLAWGVYRTEQGARAAFEKLKQP